MEVYILSGVRTPLGSLMGSLSSVPAPKLGARAISAAVEKAKVSPSAIDEVFMGHVIQAGTGQAPARQAALFAGLPQSVPSTTINKVCGSGMKAVICAAQSITANPGGEKQLMVAGGMENMSLAPHLLAHSRRGIKYGHGELVDAMILDGLWDVYGRRPMGGCAEECAQKLAISRKHQDDFAVESFQRAQESVKEKIFSTEIANIVIDNKKGEVSVEEDEGPFKADFKKMKKLPPVFAQDGSITAANASTINDGAAALVLGGAEYASKAKFKLRAYSNFAQNPTWFTTAPIPSIKKVLAQAQLTLEDIDLFEINEAFALVTLAAIKELKLDRNKVNIYGGAVALGHPIGASGARIMVTLMNAMERKKARYGLASICIGGGEALSTIIERL